MSKKSELKKQIEESEREIESLEKKRNRSQSALLQAFMKKEEPSAADKEYYQVYSELIELERQNLQKLKAELNKF